ncbi:MAG: hypothetical protein HY820_24075 [Acidobacteria bacterium]|nr:hypothetical protein [Acidobacteriota bacterium]
MPILLLLLAITPLRATGVEVQIQYSVLQKALAQQAFPQSGRMYVKGSQDNKCNFAYLENPTVGGMEGHLEIKARFTGKSATSLFGFCLGPGDTFDLRIIAVPQFHNGMIRLDSVEVETAKDGFYTKRVRESIQEKLAKKFEYNVTEDAKRILERKLPGETFQQQLRDFKVSSIRATAEALILQLEFTLIVR